MPYRTHKALEADGGPSLTLASLRDGASTGLAGPMTESEPQASESPGRRFGMALDRLFTNIAGKVALVAGQPAALICAVVIIVAWGASGFLFGYSDTWQLVANTATSLTTFLMVFLIQNSQNRDAAAIQAKLDELIRASKRARNQFIGIERMTGEDIEMVRVDLERDFAGMIPTLSAGETMRHMQDRM